MEKCFVNTKVVINMATGDVVEKEGYWYVGPVALATGADRQAFDVVLKTIYEEGVAEGVNDANPLRDIIKTEKVPFKGLELQRLMHTSRNVSPMFVGEDSAFAAAGQQGYAKFNIDQKKLMSRLRLTLEVMQ